MAKQWLNTEVRELVKDGYTPEQARFMVVYGLGVACFVGLVVPVLCIWTGLAGG